MLAITVVTRTNHIATNTMSKPTFTTVYISGHPDTAMTVSQSFLSM
jgi:hypothetical protein